MHFKNDSDWQWKLSWKLFAAPLEFTFVAEKPLERSPHGLTGDCCAGHWGLGDKTRQEGKQVVPLPCLRGPTTHFYFLLSVPM